MRGELIIAAFAVALVAVARYIPEAVMLATGGTWRSVVALYALGLGLVVLAACSMAESVGV